MADNLTIQSSTPATPSAGVTYKTKDVGGAHAPYGVEHQGTSINTPATVTVGITSQVLLAAGTNRRSVEFNNTGTTDVWICSGTAVSGQGYWLPAGGIRVFDRSANAAFNAIAITSSTTVAIGIEAE